MQLLYTAVTTVVCFCLLILWNKSRTKGKVLCLLLRSDKSNLFKLLPTDGMFIKWKDSAYEIYPDYVRLTRFPMGWPPFLQELVPMLMYNEGDSTPLDWIDLDNRIQHSGELYAALEGNWMKKIGTESPGIKGGPSFNVKRVVPALMVGAIALVLLLMFRPLG